MSSEYQYLGVQMERVERKACAEVVNLERKDHQNIHWEVCRILCDEFFLWDRDEEGQERFPNWLMFVVSGVMRELGVS
jgi:hypothetical protein